jgi:RNA polymerase sigma factor (sigma-70 family)
MRTFLSGLFARLGPPEGGEAGDDLLLSKFVSSRDEGAFHEIVRRHGAMVHGVCRRVLRNDADADDAFQAVFLVLVRKADSVRPGNRLGNWLYGVAVNVARKGREVLARRRTHELVGDVAQAEASATGELREVIDEELTRLPADYRAAVVACDLEGRTRKEAASQLGWNEGTVASRLARARAILADRLSRRGVVMPALGLGAALGESTALAALPRVALAGHSEFVTQLAGEAMRAMSISKLKTTVAVVLAAAGVVGIGAGVAYACGIGSRLIATPVSAAKPFLDRSIETSTDSNEENAWPKPMAGELDAADKLAAENGGVAKPARFMLRNPERDITVFTDRDESFVEFFRRQRVIVAILGKKEFTEATTSQKPTERVFLTSASHNEAGLLNAAYGTFARIAPLKVEIAEVTHFADTLILVADPDEKDVWHVAGFTYRSPVGFFASKDKKGRDTFAPADLIHTPK